MVKELKERIWKGETEQLKQKSSINTLRDDIKIDNKFLIAQTRKKIVEGFKIEEMEEMNEERISR